MTDKDLDALTDESDAMARDVNAKLDNAEFVFHGASGTECIQGLDALAGRCNAGGLRVAARRLKQLAREVKERSEV